MFYVGEKWVGGEKKEEEKRKKEKKKEKKLLTVYCPSLTEVY